jgi:hypothetical protein
VPLVVLNSTDSICGCAAVAGALAEPVFEAGVVGAWLADDAPQFNAVIELAVANTVGMTKLRRFMVVEIIKIRRYADVLGRELR